MLIKLYLFCFVCIFNPVFCSILWNGNFNDYSSSADLDKWSFSNQGSWPYQTYIYGNKENNNNMSSFVTLSSDYRSLIDDSARQGARIEINSESIWNGNTMLRTELIAAYDFSSSAIGKRFLHFSLKQGSTNQLLATNEHQIVFFESHFCDIRFGGGFGNKLNFVNSDGQSLWSSDLGSEVWHNFAIEIDFAENNIGLFHSTGANPLVRVVQPSSSSVGISEWHIGNLRLPLNGVQVLKLDPTPEVLYYSSLYIADTLLILSPVPGDTGNATTGSNENSDNSGSSSEHKQKLKRKTGAGTIVAAILIPSVIFAIVVALYISAKNNRAKFTDSLVEGLLDKE